MYWLYQSFLDLLPLLLHYGKNIAKSNDEVKINDWFYVLQRK